MQLITIRTVLILRVYPKIRTGLTGPSPALHYNTSIVFDIGFLFSTLYSIG